MCVKPTSASYEKGQTEERRQIRSNRIYKNINDPFFIDGSLNGETYLALLQNNVLPTMANLYPAEGNPQLPGNAIWFQQDGAPAHYALRSQCPAISLHNLSKSLVAYN
ncbi:hypothetical protein NQ318_005652 [Aromia moschata]|uniref:Uncharacterized protein n=1 Tax=Aromia moschata TaxID=1265417 RepID=A0AAV8XZA7_9CUCU|nr:hypothetical protein NQ318_005652 [Aromia moschata]